MHGIPFSKITISRRQGGKKISFSLGRDEKCKFVDEWILLIYSTVPDENRQIVLKFYTIPKTGKVMPEPDIYYIQQFTTGEIYNITVSQQYAMIFREGLVEKYELWNLAEHPTVKIPLTPFFRMKVV